MSKRKIIFDPFCLDQANECLWRGSTAINLRPKAFALLSYLVERPGQLVTKEQLLDAVWPGTFVAEAVLKNTVGQLRETLEDDPKSPRFIETAHRRGYRFIGLIAEGVQPMEKKNSYATAALPPPVADSDHRVVGRDEPLALMHRIHQKAMDGERQILFITGEAGIGKTALVDAFVRSIASDGRTRIVLGQCLEHYGTSEGYLPFLEAIGRLCRENPELVDVLRAHAPMWLLQMPSLVTATERESLRRELQGATRERMLREMGDALEALTADAPLVFILEDLHWSDCSTLDLVSYLARHRHPAQLMLIGTYRPVELIISGHPLKAVKQELLSRQQCEELPLKYLCAASVATYLSVRFPGNQFRGDLARLIHERTEGNPLFMVNAVDYLVTEQSIREAEEGWQLAVDISKVDVGVPQGIRQMIEKQLDHLPEEHQRMLETASVAGVGFSTFALATISGEDQAVVEDLCHDLARDHHFIQDGGSKNLPGGEAVACYGFIHALYQNVLYDRVSALRRIQLHRRMGELEEELYGERAGEIAAELAMHFERGAKIEAAVKYLRLAAENAIRRFAYREAVELARRGLELLKRLPDTTERAEQELWLQVTLGVPLIATRGYAAPEVCTAYTRARELCRLLGDTPEISQVLWGLWLFYLLKAELGTTREIAEEFLRLAARLPYSGLEMRGHFTMEVTLIHLGEFEKAMEHFEKALALYDPVRHRDESLRYSQNSGVGTQCHAAWALWILGYPDQALERIGKALELGRELSEPHGLAHAFFFAAIIHQLRREVRKARDFAEASIAVSRKHELVLYEAMATIVRGWALTEQGNRQEGIQQMHYGIAAHKATGTEVLLPHFLALLAESLGRDGQAGEGLRVLEEALAIAHRNSDRYYESELYRIKGELLLLKSRDIEPGAAEPGHDKVEGEAAAFEQVESCFGRSLEIAEQQKAKSWKLRAAMSLAHLYANNRSRDAARDLLSRTYISFHEGFDTADLREARALLDKLS